jgi:hypothetical protein
MHQCDERQHPQTPGEPAREPDALLAGIAQLDRKAQAEQEREDREELAESQQVFEVFDHMVDGTEQHEIRTRLLAGEETRGRMRHDDPEQGIGAQHVDNRDAFAGQGQRGCALHVSGLPLSI